MPPTSDQLPLEPAARSAPLTSEEEVGLLLNNTPHSFYLLDKGGNVLLFNETARKLYKSLVGNGNLEVGAPVEELLASMYADNRSVLLKSCLEGNITEYDRELIYHNGISRWAHVTFGPAFDRTGKIVGITFSAEDIHERVQVMMSRIAAERELGAKSTVDGIRHDFNNMLAAILGYSQLGELAEDLSEAQGLSQRISGITREAARLVARLSKEYVGELELGLYDIQMVIDNVLTLIPPSPNAQIIRTYSESSIEVVVDSQVLQQAFHNIIINALTSVEANPEDKDKIITIRVWETPDNAYVSVGDTGPGIPPEMIGRIFERYYTTSNDPTTKGKGMGLNIAWEAVRAHNGDISVRCVSKTELNAPFELWDTVLSEGTISKRALRTGTISTGSTFIIRLPQKKQ